MRCRALLLLVFLSSRCALFVESSYPDYLLKSQAKATKWDHFEDTTNFLGTNRYTQSNSACSKCQQAEKLRKIWKNPWNHGFPPQIQSSMYNVEELLEFNLKTLLNRIKVVRFLRSYQKELSRRRRQLQLLIWEKSTNLTEYNIKNSIQAELDFTVWHAEKRNYARNNLTLEGLSCSQSKMLKTMRKSDEIKEESLRKESLQLSNRMQKIYSNAKVCDRNSPRKCYKYEPGLTKIFAKSRDYDTLLWAWKGWRDAIGPKIRQDWLRDLELNNLGARENGFDDLGDYVRSFYNVDDLRSRVESLWEQIRPMYLQLHAYVRYKLHQVYGERVSLSGPIPAHLLGNVWAMQWTSIIDICKPYKDVEGFKVNQGMKRLNYTVHKMFKVADDFYQSIGLPAMPVSFWKKSMFVRPKNRSVVCYASAFNLESTDVRLKMCSQVNQEYLYIAHHEMGHCQYYLGYNLNQPELFQSGANPGFHEAIGDTAALSVINPTHLKKLGILSEHENQRTKMKRHINFLLERALQKLAFFPYALTLDSWRWKVYSGEIPVSRINSAWWEERLRYGGIAPPVQRSELDFDPGSKYHVVTGTPYIRYFISHLLQFQFYEAMCKYAGHQGPLYLCDFGSSKSAGKRFRDMLNEGSNEHWEDTLFKMTGSCNMKVSSLKKYFEPLLEWLNKENKRLGNKIGWD